MANMKDWAVTPLRFILGLLFFIPGIMKLLNPSTIIGMIQQAGLPMATLQGWLVLSAEIVGGASILVGWKTKYLAWIPIPVMIGAIFIGVLPYGGPMLAINLLFHLLAISGCIAIALGGPGKIALD